MIFETDQPPFVSVAIVPKAVIDEISKLPFTAMVKKQKQPTYTTALTTLRSQHAGRDCLPLSTAGRSCWTN